MNEGDFTYKFIDPIFPEDYKRLLGRAIGLEKLLAATLQENRILRCKAIPEFATGEISEGQNPVMTEAKELLDIGDE